MISQNKILLLLSYNSHVSTSDSNLSKLSGPLGFLSTQDEHCPGNNGLKDQQEALRFLQKTVESFGGDPNSVTIFGESAGGASVHYHMISETSAGKYFTVITEYNEALLEQAINP